MTSKYGKNNKVANKAIAKWRWQNGSHLCEGDLKKVLIWTSWKFNSLHVRNTNIGGNHMKENVRLWEDIILYCPLNQDVLLSTVHLIRTEKKNWKQTWFTKAFHSNEPRLVTNTWPRGALILNRLSCRLVPYFPFVTRAVPPSKKKWLWGYWILAILLQINVIVIHLSLNVSSTLLLWIDKVEFS